jgi:hypothetical protein
VITANIRELFVSLQGDLDRVCRKFEHPKVTLVVRAPELEDGDVVISNDDPDAVIVAITRHKNRGPVAESKPEADPKG